MPRLEAPATLSTGDVRLDQDFDDLPDDAALVGAGWQPVDVGTPLESSTWTVTNPGGQAQPATRSGFPSQGRFVISDSDLGGQAQGNTPGSGMSHDLWSPRPTRY